MPNFIQSNEAVSTTKINQISSSSTNNFDFVVDSKIQPNQIVNQQQQQQLNINNNFDFVTSNSQAASTTTNTNFDFATTTTGQQ